MAITAAITLSASTINANQKTTATCTVTNSGSSAVNVTAMTPFAAPTGTTKQSVSCAVGMPPLGPGMTVAVPGSSGTLAVLFDVIPQAPQANTTAPGQVAEPTSFQYDIGCYVYTSDGSQVAATVATVTVNEFL